MDPNKVLDIVIAAAPLWGPLAVAATHWLLSKLPARQRALASEVVATAVPAVEQMYKAFPGSGQQKKAEVERLVPIELARLGVKVDPATLNALVEAAVASLPGSVAASSAPVPPAAPLS